MGNLTKASMAAYLVDEIINFLVTYTSFEKKNFKVIGRQGPQTAINLVKKQMIK